LGIWGFGGARGRPQVEAPSVRAVQWGAVARFARAAEISQMNRNDRLLLMVLKKLNKARLRPPTVASLLLHWGSLPSLVPLGVVSVVALDAVGLPSPVAALVAGICLGAALRDLGIALRAVRLWPIQQELFDWQKIDALTQGMAEPQDRPDTA